MNNEKMMILKMLEERKITADEAARLLSAAENSGGAKPAPDFSAIAPKPSRSYSDGPQPNRPSGHSSAHKPGEPSMVDDISRKFGAFVKDMEPKVKKGIGIAVEKTASAADSLSKSLSSSKPAHSGYAPQQSAYPAAPKPPARPSAPAGKGIEESIEIHVAHAGAQLNLAGLNGQVLVKGYNGDKISAKIFTVAKRAGAKIQLATLGNKYYLSYDENDFERVCIDAFVPETMFDFVHVSTINGDVRVATISCNSIKIENLNGSTETSQIKADNITIEQNNGKLAMDGLNARAIHAENFNGAISASAIDASKLVMTTFNGAVDMQIAQFASFDHYDWKIETGNEKLNLALPSYVSLGYHVKAHAALNTVKLGLVGMDYIRNDKSMIEAKSINYNDATKKVDLVLETSNAPLVVN